MKKGTTGIIISILVFLLALAKAVFDIFFEKEEVTESESEDKPSVKKIDGDDILESINARLIDDSLFGSDELRFIKSGSIRGPELNNSGFGYVAVSNITDEDGDHLLISLSLYAAVFKRNRMKGCVNDFQLKLLRLSLDELRDKYPGIRTKLTSVGMDGYDEVVIYPPGNKGKSKIKSIPYSKMEMSELRNLDKLTGYRMFDVVVSYSDINELTNFVMDLLRYFHEEYKEEVPFSDEDMKYILVYKDGDLSRSIGNTVVKDYLTY